MFFLLNYSKNLNKIIAPGKIFSGFLYWRENAIVVSGRQVSERSNPSMGDKDDDKKKKDKDVEEKKDKKKEKKHKKDKKEKKKKDKKK
jgi:hypothetical protein